MQLQWNILTALYLANSCSFQWLVNKDLYSDEEFSIFKCNLCDAEIQGLDLNLSSCWL